MHDTGWPHADGETAARIRAFDWSTTPLGPMEGWSPRLRAFVDMVLLNPAPSALLWGGDGIMLYNDGYARICGVRHPDVLGGPLREAWPEAWEFNGRVLADCLQGQQRIFNKVCFPLWRDGALRDSWFDLYYGPLPGDDGHPVAVLATVVEITDQVEAAQLRDARQRQLNVTTARLRALTSATADVVYRMNADWTELRELDGRGIVADVVLPRRSWMDDYVDPDDHPLVRAAIGEAIATRSPYVLEHRVRRMDGSDGWILSRAVPMLDAAGGIEEWIGTASDITARKAGEKKLKEADRLKDEFLAMLAHELRNPLAPIRAAAELLQLARLDMDRVRHTSRIIGRQVAHMTDLIDDLLDVSRVTRGQVRLARAPVDVARVVRDAVEQVGPLLRARRHALALDLPAAGAALVEGDAKRLVQIVGNILNNAAKYTRDGGHVAVRVHVTGGDAGADAGRVAIDVTDDGVGMAPETAARAFVLFAQAERSVDRATGGLGLGLALVKSLVELHGGTVACASPGLGHGSTFTVRLPRLAAPADAAAHPAAPAAPGAMVPARIVVVDDNVDAAAMLGLLLRAAGHSVAVEHDSLAAYERIVRERPEVCLVDIGLPGMDGNELARRLRALPPSSGLAGLRLIAVTGYGQDSDRRRSREAGFNAHLVKPIDTAALYALLAGTGDLPSH